MAGRHRGFGIVFYPESAPENFREIISSWNVPGLLAIHDKDEDTKTHAHLLLMFGGMKSLSQVRTLAQQLASSLVEPVHDLRGAARYLGHLDQPEKHFYGVEVVESFSGASIPELMAATGNPGPDVQRMIREQGWVSYAQLMDYCQDDKIEWWSWCSSHSVFLCAYMRSLEWESR